MQKLLIIAGTSRAGSTSTYRYLADHPAICAATMKETGYFLGDDIPLPRAHRYSPSLAGYSTYFRGSTPDQTWMEATPHYLYSAGVAERIYQADPQTRLIFLLREPTSRLISWYRFGMQEGMLLKRLSFEEFIAAQHPEPTVHTPYPLRAMAEGQYTRYLSSWVQQFPREQLLIVKYTDLSRDPLEIMRQISVFAGIDPQFYDRYEFESHNPSFEVRSIWVGKLYSAVEWRTQRILRKAPARASFAALGRHLIIPIYRKINAKPHTRITIPDSVRTHLEDYYRDLPRELADVLGLDSWTWD